jgi:hypothetical protein
MPAPKPLVEQAAQLLADAGLDQPQLTSEPPQPAADQPQTETLAVQQSDARNIAILADLDDGLSYREAARKHGVSLATVGRLALRMQSMADAARNYMAAKGLDAAEHWLKASATAAQKGDHRPAKDWLLHTGAIDPVADSNGQGRTQVAIIIGTPDSPIRVNSSKD